MRVVSTWSPPNAVLFSELLDSETLFVCKSSRLDVVSLKPEGMIHACSIDIWGSVTSMNILKDTARVLLTTDHPRPTALIIQYHPPVINASTKAQDPARLEVLHHSSLISRSGRLAEYFQGAIIHHPTRLAVSSAYSANVRVLGLEASDPRKNKWVDFDCRIPELNILSMCFLPESSTPHPTLAILHVDYKLERRLVARRVDVREKDISVEASPALPPCFVQTNASLVIPFEGIDDHPGGVIVFGGGAARLFSCLKEDERGNVKGETASQRSAEKAPASNKKKRARTSSGDVGGGVSPGDVELPFEDVVAHTFIDERRILISDVYGRLALLVLITEQDTLRLVCVQLGSTPSISSPSSLSYLNAGIIYVGSAFGDSQLARLLEAPSENGETYIEVLETYKNIAPVGDAIITQAEGSSQIVTCSGMYSSGSLRVIRKGADFQELRIVEQVPHVTDIFPLRNSPRAEVHQFMLLSTSYSSQLIEFGKSKMLRDVPEDEFSGLQRESSTLACSNCEANHGTALVQVTSKGVRVIDATSGELQSMWPAPGTSPEIEITVASCDGQRIVIALQGGDIVYFVVKDDLTLKVMAKTQVPSTGTPLEVSALSLQSWNARISSGYVAMSFWATNTISILSLPKLQPLSSLGLSSSEENLPRSLLLHSFDTSSTPPTKALYLFAGLANGTLVSYELDASFNVKSRRTMNSGSSPLKLSVATHGTTSVVFVAGSRPAVVAYENGRLQYSPIVTKDVVSASMLHSGAFPDSIILANRDSLVIGKLRELKKLHIRTIPMGLENPQRISYDPDNKVFGLCVLRTNLHPTILEQPTTSLFRILDENTFETVVEFELDELEDATCVGSYGLLASDDSKVRQYFVIGSERRAKSDPDRGTLRVYKYIPGGSAELVASLRTAGCVMSVNTVDNKIVACIDSAVVVYSLAADPTEPHRYTLTPLSKWERGYQLINVRVHGHTIVIADALRSLDVLEWREGRLNLRARDHSSLWPVAMESIDADTTLVAEGQGNIFTYRVDDKTGLDRAGAFHLGEQVTEIRGGSLNTVEPNAPVVPEMGFFTATGRIGIISSLNDQLSLSMTYLQRNIGHVVKGPGNLDHSIWRAPHNATGPLFHEGGEEERPTAIGFIDGDFIEQYTELSDKDLEKVRAGANEYERLTDDHARVLQELEQLQTAH